MLIKENFCLIAILFLTDLTPLVSQAIFVILNFSSGSSTLPPKKILPSRTLTDNLIKYILINLLYFDQYIFS